MNDEHRFENRGASHFTDHIKEFDKKNPPPPQTHKHYDWIFTKNKEYPDGVYSMIDPKAYQVALVITHDPVALIGHKTDRLNCLSAELVTKDFKTQKYESQGIDRLKNALDDGEAHADQYRMKERLATPEIFRRSRSKNRERER